MKAWLSFVLEYIGSIGPIKILLDFVAAGLSAGYCIESFSIFPTSYSRARVPICYFFLTEYRYVSIICEKFKYAATRIANVE